MQKLSETSILKRYSQPPGDPPDTNELKPSGSISVFPTSLLDMPSETFESALKRRDKNHRNLIQWIQKNLHPDVDYGRVHVFEQCPYARAGAAHLCSNFSHMSMITLWKSGSEKICRLLGLSVHFPNVHQYELAAVHKQEITQVVLKCELKTNNGTIVGEGSGARHIRQDDWNLNKAIKMTQKSAVIDATIRVAGLTGVFIKTHRHTVKNKFPGMSVCNNNNLPPGGSCSNTIPRDKPITQRQKDLIQKVSGRNGKTKESLERLIQDLFNKNLDDLNRVEASKLIQQSL